MKKNALWSRILVAVPVVAATALAAVAPNTRSYVSNVGSDANTCTLVRPCATFAGAYAKTVAGGEIDVLTTGEYGPLEITHAFTIDGQGSQATVTVAQGQNQAYAIWVNAGASDNVVVRNLSFSGGANNHGNNTTGVAVSTAGTVILQNLLIDGFDNGVLNGDVNGNAGTSGASFLLLQDVRISNVDGDGVLLFNNTGAGPYVSVLRNTVITESPGATGFGIFASGAAVASDVTGATISGGSFGVYVLSGAEVHVKDSSVQYANTAGVEAFGTTGHATLNNCLVANNVLGVKFFATSTLISYGNNQFSNNTTDGTFSSTATLQ